MDGWMDFTHSSLSEWCGKKKKNKNSLRGKSAGSSNMLGYAKKEFLFTIIQYYLL